MSAPEAGSFEGESRSEEHAWRAANLSQISTRWPLISDPVQFVFRYAEPIHRYLAAIIKNPHDAEEVRQDFLLRSFQHGFIPERIAHGKFRNYLKAAVRNAAISHFRHQASAKSSGLEGHHERLVAPEPALDDAQEQWLQPWRQCLLDRVWQALDHHQRGQPDSLAYTALRLVVDYPAEDSVQLAARATQIAGRTIRAGGFRKHLSRARRIFARLLVEEVARTLERPTPEAVEEELLEIGLMPYIRALLPNKGDRRIY